MTHDPATFEGDWWFLTEEEELERAPSQMRTLRDGVVVCEGTEIGAYRVADRRLIFKIVAPGASETIFGLPPEPPAFFGEAAPAPALDYLSGTTTEAPIGDDDEPWSTCSTLIRVR